MFSLNYTGSEAAAAALWRDVQREERHHQPYPYPLHPGRVPPVPALQPGHHGRLHQADL